MSSVSNTSDDEDRDRETYFEEFTCDKCGELGYKRPGNVRNTCNKCRINAMKERRRERKEILKQLREEEEEMQHLSKQVGIYERATVYDKLSSDSDTSFSQSDNEQVDPSYDGRVRNWQERKVKIQ